MKKYHASQGTMRCKQAMGDEFPEEIKTNIKAPWNDELSKIDEDSTLLSEQKSEMICVLAMKGEFIVKRSKLGLEPGFTFLAARVSNSKQ